MSKIGKINISIPEKVKVALSGNLINIEGPLGKKSLNIDIDMFDLLGNCSRKFSIILTKIDKVSKSYLDYQKKSILSLMKNYKDSFKNIYQSETKKNNGITEIQRSIYGISQSS